MATRSSKKKKTPFAWVKARTQQFLSKRPHRSFRRTQRRDALKPLQLPGYIALTHSINKTVWKYRKHLFSLALFYAVFYALLIGIGSQETYTSLVTSVQETGEALFGGDLTVFAQVGTVFLSLMNVGLGGALTEAQQIYGILLGLLIWLTTVWLLRNLLAGHRVKLRDGLYNAGAPLIATIIVALILVVQLIPLGIAAIGYSAAASTGLLAGGIEAMLFWSAAGLLAILSLFWITSSFFALIIVTLPGTYPFKALSIAGDMVLGRRLKILLRLLWMVVVMSIAWTVVLIPFILIDMWLKATWPQIEWLPIIPVVLLLLTSVTSVWVASYVYLLYRKVVDEDAKHK